MELFTHRSLKSTGLACLEHKLLCTHKYSSYRNYQTAYMNINIFKTFKEIRMSKKYSSKGLTEMGRSI